MKKARSRQSPDEMLPEYDFAGGVRGKHAKRFPADSVLVLLDADVARLFPDTMSVNDALRALGRILRASPRRAKRRGSAR